MSEIWSYVANDSVGSILVMENVAMQMKTYSDGTWHCLAVGPGGVNTGHLRDFNSGNDLVGFTLVMRIYIFT
jgi:hypothetical protein